MSKLPLLAALLLPITILPLTSTGALAAEPATPEVRIAFFGDQGLGGDAEAVLQLVDHEGADAVVHMGDFGYTGDPEAWEAQINAFLGEDFPYFASVGNHDEGDFYGPGGYQELLAARMNRLGIPWEGDLGVQSTFHFEGIFIVFTAPGSFGDGDRVHAPFIRDALARDDSAWSISAWHKNMQRMQLGGKGDETGWGVYEESRRGGAIIATGHEHSYSRTHLLADVDRQLVASTDEPLLLAADDPATPEDEGRSFVFVSGLGGKSIRNQERGGPWWASVYTSDQGAQSGALFGVFNYHGDPNLARFYFKNVSGEVIDDFLVARSPDPTSPVLAIDDVAIQEGDAGSSEAVFQVTLLSPNGGEVAVDWATGGGDATAGADYEPVSGRLTFSGESTAQTVRVPIWGDESAEADETVLVNLSAPEGAVLLRTSGVATIVDDDGPEPRDLTVTTQGSGSVVLDPPGGSYAPGTAVTLTAVPAPGHAFAGWSGDLSGAASHASLVVDRDLVVGARFVLLGASLQELRTGKSSSSSSVTTTAALAAVDDDLYLAAVAVKPNVAVTGVSGLGLAWSPLRSQCSARSQTRLEVWHARGRPTADGVVTATLSAPARNAVVAVSRYAGVGALDPLRGASANTLGAAGACSGGSDGQSYALALDTTTPGSLLYLAAAARNRDHAPGSGWVERMQFFAGSGGDVAGISVAEHRAGAAGPVGVNGRFDGDVDWAVVAFEIPMRLQLTVEASSGGSVSVHPPGGTYERGTLVTLTAACDPGFAFAGWQGDLSGAANPAQLVMDADKSVAATFVTEFSVSVGAAAGGEVTLDPPGGLYDLGTVVRLTAVPAPRHRFGGWSGDLAGAENPATLVVDADKSVAAAFVPQPTLAVTASAGGAVSLDPPGGVYDPGTAVRLTAVPAPHHRFGGWSGDLAGAENPATLVVDADKSVSAAFVSDFTVTVAPVTGGAVSLDPPGGIYGPLTMVRVTATAAPGYRFAGWSGHLAGAQNPATLLMLSDKSIGAEFLPEFALDVAPGAGGTIALDPPGGVYAQGSSVTLTAVAAPGHRFGGWSGDLAGVANPATLVVDAHKSVGAVFAPEFAVAVAPSAGGAIALDPPGGLYGLGSVVRLTALAAAGHAFAGWSGDLSGMINPASLVVDRDRAAGARFVALQNSLQEVRTGKSANASVVSSASPLAAQDDDLYLVAIASKPYTPVASVSGLGLAWSPLRSQCSGRGQTGVTIWHARGRPSAGGVVTATFSAAVRNAVLSVSRYAGVGEIDPVRSASANTRGVAGACTGGVDSDSYAFPFATTAPDSLVYVAASGRHRDHLPGTGWVERAQISSGSSGDVASVSVADLRAGPPASLVVDGRFDGDVDWAVVTLEIPLPLPAP